MQKYQSHRVVEAAKIDGIYPCDHPDYKLTFAGDEPPVVVPIEWVARHKPAVGWYFLKYDDGYTSACPAESFEKGYTLYDAHQYTGQEQLRALRRQYEVVERECIEAQTLLATLRSTMGSAGQTVRAPVAAAIYGMDAKSQYYQSGHAAGNYLKQAEAVPLSHLELLALARQTKQADWTPEMAKAMAMEQQATRPKRRITASQWRSGGCPKEWEYDAVTDEYYR